MAKRPEHDEYLEQLWYMKEEGKASLETLKTAMNGAFDPKFVDQLLSEGLIHLDAPSSSINLTAEGEIHTRAIIRAHRIAERLLYDVLGGEFEPGACEFEHTVSSEIVDSICTLLGHPKECPHGMPIPEGECCKRLAKTALSCVLPLTELTPGQTARIAYINCRNDQLLHRLESLCLRPGAMVRLHQNYPTYVLECEGASIALDQEVVANICVWKNCPEAESNTTENTSSKKQSTRGLAGIFRFLSKK